MIETYDLVQIFFEYWVFGKMIWPFNVSYIAAKSKMALILQAQIINLFNLEQNRSRFVILASTIGFSGMSDIVVYYRKYYRHYIVGEILYCHHLSKVEQ